MSPLKILKITKLFLEWNNYRNRSTPLFVKNQHIQTAFQNSQGFLHISCIFQGIFPCWDIPRSFVWRIVNMSKWKDHGEGFLLAWRGAYWNSKWTQPLRVMNIPRNINFWYIKIPTLKFSKFLSFLLTTSLSNYFAFKYLSNHSCYKAYLAVILSFGS